MARKKREKNRRNASTHRPSTERPGIVLTPICISRRLVVREKHVVQHGNHPHQNRQIGFADPGFDQGRANGVDSLVPMTWVTNCEKADAMDSAYGSGRCSGSNLPTKT
jgi:hypothetical protein